MSEPTLLAPPAVPYLTMSGNLSKHGSVRTYLWRRTRTAWTDHKESTVAHRREEICSCLLRNNLAESGSNDRRLAL